jgi:hypothetical protein
MANGETGSGKQEVKCSNKTSCRDVREEKGTAKSSMRVMGEGERMTRRDDKMTGDGMGRKMRWGRAGEREETRHDKAGRNNGPGRRAKHPGQWFLDPGPPPQQRAAN